MARPKKKKDVHIPEPENVILYGKRDFADMTKLGSGDKERILDYAGGPNQTTRVLKSRETSAANMTMEEWSERCSLTGFEDGRWP